jgi:hypothetical protein
MGFDIRNFFEFTHYLLEMTAALPGRASPQQQGQRFEYPD